MGSCWAEASSVGCQSAVQLASSESASLPPRCWGKSSRLWDGQRVIRLIIDTRVITGPETLQSQGCATSGFRRLADAKWHCAKQIRGVPLEKTAVRPWLSTVGLTPVFPVQQHGKRQYTPDPSVTLPLLSAAVDPRNTKFFQEICGD